MVLQLVAVGYLPLVCVHKFSQCLHGFTVSSCWLVLAILQRNHLRRSKLGQRQHPVIPVLTMHFSFCCGPNMKVLEVSSSSPSSLSPTSSSPTSSRSLPSPRPCQAWLHLGVHHQLFSCFLWKFSAKRKKHFFLQLHHWIETIFIEKLSSFIIHN